MKSMTRRSQLSVSFGLALLTACDPRAGAEAPTEISVKTEQARPAHKGEIVPISASFSVISDMKRKGGVEEDGALVCRKATCPKGIVAFGPYTSSVGPGPRVATFRVRGGGVSKLDRKVVMLDVYEALTKQPLAARAVKGTELPDQRQQSFDLPFTAPMASKLEFRIGWSGDGELRMYRVDVR